MHVSNSCSTSGAYSHQEKAGAKVKKIKEQAKQIKNLFAFTRCEWASNPKVQTGIEVIPKYGRSR